MKALAAIGYVGLALVLFVPSAVAQELRLDLSRKREVVRPALDTQAVVREAEQAVREYQEQVAQKRLTEELQVRRRPDLDPAITQGIQAQQVQPALRDFRR